MFEDKIRNDIINTIVTTPTVINEQYRDIDINNNKLWISLDKFKEQYKHNGSNKNRLFATFYRAERNNDEIKLYSTRMTVVIKNKGLGSYWIDIKNNRRHMYKQYRGQGNLASNMNINSKLSVETFIMLYMCMVSNMLLLSFDGWVPNMINGCGNLDMCEKYNILPLFTPENCELTSKINNLRHHKYIGRTVNFK